MKNSRFPNPLLILTLALALMLGLAVAAHADTDVSYIDENGQAATCANATALTGNETELAGGWYVVKDHISYATGPLCMSGDVNLILADGGELEIKDMDAELYGGLLSDFNDSHTNYPYGLKVYGQSGQSGKIFLNREYNCCFLGHLSVYGGGITTDGCEIAAKNAIVVKKGTITIKTGNNASLAGDTIEISGGTVNAPLDARQISISGGTVDAEFLYTAMGAD